MLPTKSTPTDTLYEAIPHRIEADMFDPRASLGSLRHAIVGHVGLILLSCAFTIGIVVSYVVIFPPIYRAEVIVAGEAREDASRASYYSIWNVFRKADLESEPELLTSGHIMRQVVDRLDLKFNDVHHTFLTHVTYLWTDSWVGKRYRALKEWLFPPAYKPTPAQEERARTVKAFKDGVRLEPVPNTIVAKLVVRAPSHRAADYANAITDVYLAERRRLASAEAETAYKALEVVLVRAKEELDELEQEKVAFEKGNAVSLEFEKDKILVGKWVDLRASIYDLEATIASLQAHLAVVERQLKDEPREVIGGRTFQDSNLRATMQATAFELKSRLQQARERYVADSPEVRELQRLLAQTQAAVEQEPDKGELAQNKVLSVAYQTMRQRQQDLNAQLAAHRASLAVKREALQNLTARIEELPALGKTSRELARTRDGLETRYKLLRERLMMAEVSRAAAASAPASIRVVDYAETPFKQSWPDLKILLPAAALLGLLGGIGLALLSEFLSPRVTRERLAGRPDLPVYAVIGLRNDGGDRARIAVQDAPNHAGTALARLRRPP